MSRSIDLLINNIRMSLYSNLHPLRSFFIEINSTCNQRCRHCYIPDHLKMSILPLDHFIKCIDHIKEDFGNSVSIPITGGEPLLHPKLINIIQILNCNNFNWSLSTNGLLLDQDLIDQLIGNNCSAITISLDGNEESHDIQRQNNGSYKSVMNAIDLLLDNDFKNLYITSTLHNGNIDSLNEIRDLIIKYKNLVNWRINPLLYCENVKRNDLSISEETYRKICSFIKNIQEEQKINIILGEKNPLSIKYGEFLYSDFDSCLAGVITFGMLANGDIVNCMVCREKVLGNISNINNLKNIWAKEDLTKKGLCERHIESKNSLFKKNT